MKGKITLFAAALATVVGSSIFATTLVHAFFYAPEDELPAAEVSRYIPAGSVSPDRNAASSTAPALPLRLLIPHIGVDAAVQHVGIGKTGNMAVPNNFTDVGWYRYGPIPGEAGSAVIDGHVDNGFGLPGVFKHLSQVVVGDDIYVETQDGGRLHFTVTDIEAYPHDAAPTGLIFSRNGPARLVLITCEGTWVPGEKTYDHRLVIFAMLR